MQASHDRLIAVAAKAALGALDFRRKGRSRLWFADFGWWLAVVEFQPSSWSKGSYLNVGAHWLWGEMGCISFDFGGRLSEFEAYRSDAQFALVADRLARMAELEARRLIQTFSSLENASEVLLREVRASRPTGAGHPAWSQYHAGVASALVGRSLDASEMFAAILDRPALKDSKVHEAALRMAQLMPRPMDFKREICALITQQRAALRLPALSAPPIE